MSTDTIETTAVAVRPAMSVAKRNWTRAYRKAFKERNGYSTRANDGCGGLRKHVLERDGYRCVKCGMTDQEHKVRWNRPITVDHKDRNRKHNELSNLQTLCLVCHGRKDISASLVVLRCETKKQHILALRKSGKTYQQIADSVGFSVAAVWKWIKRWEVA